MGIGRNDSCHCGSGKKYKKCCLSKDEESRGPLREAWATVGKISLIKRSQDYPVERCLLNQDWKETGLARITVLRRQANSSFIIGLYLVDIFCLGVKDTFCNVEITDEQINGQILPKQYFEDVPLDISLDFAKAIIWGGVKYAKVFGFEPNADFELSRCVLGAEGPEDSYDIHFGGPDGKPLYIPGPYDDQNAIMRKLSKSTTQQKQDELKPRCGLCGKTKNLAKTECCGQWICDDEENYVLFSYARNSCSRNHRRFTLCGYHHTEGHPGSWKDCSRCRKDFETEEYVHCGTNEYNFEKLENPPVYEPTKCAGCGEVIHLGEGEYMQQGDEYWCEPCGAKETGKMLEKRISDKKGRERRNAS